MAGPYDFTDQNIENTYQRVLQTPDGTTFYDGTGSLVTLPSANTASLLTTASATGNTITFTKGNGSTFPVTVTGGSGTPTFPYTGSAIISGSLIITGSLTTNDGVYVSTITASFISASGGITGSLFGTSSWASSASVAISSSYSSTASYALNGGVTKIIAGGGITISPSLGLGDVTINSTAANFNTATGSYGSFHDTGSVLATSATTIYSMSLSTTDISNGVYVSGSGRTRVYVTNAGVYNFQFSAQFRNTDTSDEQHVAVWIRKNNISSANDIVDSNSLISVSKAKGGNPGETIAAWNFFQQLAAGDFIELLWHAEVANVITLETIAAGTNPVHPRTPSLILTANRIDTFLSNTGSFSGSFTGNLTGTASYSTTASYALNVLSPGDGNTSIQFNSGSTFSGSSNLTYQYNTASSDAYRLSHTSNFDLITNPYNKNFPASITIQNNSNALKQVVGLSHYQCTLDHNLGATTIYSFIATDVNGLIISGFKCDYNIMLRNSGFNFASRTGTLYGAWNYDPTKSPVLTDTYVNGDQVYNELQTVTFTLTWDGSNNIILQMDCSNVNNGSIYFNGLFTNFVNTL